MNHIKLFESFEDYYSLSDEETFNTPAVGFNDIEISTIDSMSNRFKKLVKIEKIRFDAFNMNPINEYPEDYDFFKHGFPKSSKVYQINILYVGKFLCIRKIEDEWYMIRISRLDDDKYYKCDQFDGMVKFLGDNL
jgi:hypothetical protein